jgi:hypothetical protein
VQSLHKGSFAERSRPTGKKVDAKRATALRKRHGRYLLPGDPCWGWRTPLDDVFLEVEIWYVYHAESEEQDEDEQDEDDAPDSLGDVLASVYLYWGHKRDPWREGERARAHDVTDPRIRPVVVIHDENLAFGGLHPASCCLLVWDAIQQVYTWLERSQKFHGMMALELPRGLSLCLAICFGQQNRMYLGPLQYERPEWWLYSIAPQHLRCPREL